MKKMSLRKLFDNNRFVQVFALIAAALSWLLVAMTQSYTTTRTITDVPVNIDLQSSALTSLGLYAIEGAENYIDIEIEGVRSIIGQLTADDFLVAARITGVTEPGTYDLPVVPSALNPSPDTYEIKSYSASSVRVKFDRKIPKSFPIDPQVNGLAIAPNYTEKSTYVTPNRVTVTGPLTEIERISKCVITAELSGPLDKTYSKTLPIVLLDAAGNKMDTDALHLSMDVTEAQIVIEVLKTVGLPLQIDFINEPKGFPREELEALMEKSHDSVMIAGPTDLVDRQIEINLGYIDIKKITLDKTSFGFDVQLPSDQFIRLDNVNYVTVEFDDRNWGRAAFNVSGVQMLNVPLGLDVKALADTIYDVEFIGNKDVLATMTAGDIVAEIDLSERALVSGSYSLPVRISAPGKGLVWAIGDHNVAILVEEKYDE